MKRLNGWQRLWMVGTVLGVLFDAKIVEAREFSFKIEDVLKNFTDTSRIISKQINLRVAGDRFDCRPAANYGCIWNAGLAVKVRATQLQNKLDEIYLTMNGNDPDFRAQESMAHFKRACATIILTAMPEIGAAEAVALSNSATNWSTINEVKFNGFTIRGRRAMIDPSHSYDAQYTCQISRN